MASSTSSLPSVEVTTLASTLRSACLLFNKRDDRRATLVHQKASRVVGINDAHGPQALDARGYGSPGKTRRPRFIVNNRQTIAPARKLCRQQVETHGHILTCAKRLHHARA